ncbi:hypothetical protein TCAL_09735 [Tigriopus californicus]|uniref:G-protein coupled receptors family 1 profile domain-containing protein n=1 Tax=Tigriopus californicus TaxID=6832 RepID=A0A553NUQ3_TIGCA|nr:hypothetical protein TCAL_09735 [Tigriopus californicus]
MANSSYSSFTNDSVDDYLSSLEDEKMAAMAASTADLEQMVAIIAPIFLSVVILVGFFGNLLVVLVVTFNKQMRNTTNLLILNLAVADLLFIVCKLFQFLIIQTAYVGIYTLVFMSLDRFLAVVFPIESMTWRTETNCKLVIAVTWVVTVMACVPLLFAHGVINDGIANAYCMFLNERTIPFLSDGYRWNLLTFQISFFATAYLLPLLLICGLYSVMLHRLWNQAPGGRASAESIKNKKRVIKMVLVVVIIFALSWLPIHVILIMRGMKIYPNNPVTVTMQIISHILAYSNSCVNPILYAWLSEPFRRGFWAVITCIRPSGPHGVLQNGYQMGDVMPHGRKAGHAKKPPQQKNGTSANIEVTAQPKESTPVVSKTPTKVVVNESGEVETQANPQLDHDDVTAKATPVV